ncbi:unnamed protein product [Orchesella dallaii]|uniref:Wingless n=1 Tax=Orchesella dallaii TaxID=48710 RepID=A0ABP1RCV7_9HEXA
MEFLPQTCSCLQNTFHSQIFQLDISEKRKTKKTTVPIANAQGEDDEVTHEFTLPVRVARSRGNVYRRRNSNRVRDRKPAPQRRIDNYGADGSESWRSSANEDSYGYAAIIG